jgi:hypothetical protein
MADQSKCPKCGKTFSSDFEMREHQRSWRGRENRGTIARVALNWRCDKTASE